MAKDIKTGVELFLKDGFSQGIKKAANESKGFADKTLGAINKIDGALSGTAAKFAAFGVTFSLGVATKGIISLDHRMARLGLTANAGAEQIAALKRGIFEAAQSPDIKLDPTEIVSALEVIMTKTGDLKFAEDNIRNVALAIQASGEAGAPMGDVFSEFAKAGYKAREISGLLNDMVAQSDKGEFTFAEFAKNAKGVISAYSAIGNSPDDIKRANAAMQILTAGTKSSEVATTVLNSTINELTDPVKRAKLEKLGITIRDKTTGKLRDFNEIMLDLAAASEDIKKADYINSIFGSEAQKSLRAYGSEFAAVLPRLLDLGDTSGQIEEKSSKMAKTLQSNLVNLQTAFISFADSNLSKPLENITAGLNKLAEDPERVKKVFTGIAIGLGAIATVKGIAGIARLIGSLERLKGGDIKLTETWSQASAMPVYVTNWGGAAMPGASLGVPPAGTPPGGILLDQYGRPIASQPKIPAAPGKSQPFANAVNAIKSTSGRQYAAGAITAGLFAAIYKIPKMFNELETIKNNTELTDTERGRAKGGAIGDAAGSIVGASAGGAAGIAAAKAIAASLPVVGGIVGALAAPVLATLGMQFGGKAGRALGEKAGESPEAARRAGFAASIVGTAPGALAVGIAALGMWLSSKAGDTPSSTMIPAANLPPDITAYSRFMPEPRSVKLDGQVGMGVNVTVQDDRVKASAYFDRGNIPPWLNTGGVQYARGWN